jgi:Mce-associated membrane protein
MRNTTLLKPALVAVSLLAVVALGFAAWFGYGWAHALIVEKPTATARDDALTGARQVAVNLNTVNPEDLDGTFANMESSITGDDMVASLNETRDALAEQIRQTGAKSEAQVLDATLTDFSRDEGTATALVVLTSTTTWPDRDPSKIKLTMRIGLTEVDDQWKGSKVEPIGTPQAMDAGTPAVPGPAPAPATDGAEAPAPDAGDGG